MTIDSLPEDASKSDCAPGPSATMACPASACTSSIILSTDPPLSFPGAPRSFLFPVCFFCFYLLGAQVQVCSLSFFSTVIHKFAQTFLRNFIDAENGKVYLRPQIEPEA
jgi:hypothetical protein